MAVVVFLMVLAIALLVHFMPSINSNENTNQSTQETKLNTSNILSEKQENMQQMNISNNIRNVIEEKENINMTNNNKVVIKPQIENEIMNKTLNMAVVIRAVAILLFLTTLATECYGGK